VVEHTFRQGKCVHCGITWFDLWSCGQQRGSDVSRLSDLVAQAAAVAPRQSAKIEDRARRIIASEAPLEDLQDESFGPHESILAEAVDTMHGLKHALAPLTNNPPLSTPEDLPPAQPPDPLNPGPAGVPGPGR
jgi:hypothetical protein